MRKYVWSTGMAAMMAAGLFFAEPFPAQAAEPMPAGVSVDGESLEGLTEAEAGPGGRADHRGNVLCGQLR